MRNFAKLDDSQLIARLKAGDIGVIPTDTLYGIVAQAANQSAVERVYAVRGRVPEKPCIILIADVKQISDTSAWTQTHWNLASRYWPGPLSLVAPVTGATPAYLHRGTHTLAYRVPAHEGLRKLLEATGPLIAPSANLEGKPPATTIDQARAYFGENVELYVDAGQLEGQPSTLATVVEGKAKVLRQGAVHIVETA